MANLRVSAIEQSDPTAIYDAFGNKLDLDNDNDGDPEGAADADDLPASNFANADYDNIGIDVTDPSLSFIDATKGGASFTSGTARIGEIITLNLTFSEDVQVDADLTITLNTDGTAVITSGTVSDNLVLQAPYTVAEGDEIDELDITSFDLSGVNLTDNPPNAYNGDNKPNKLDAITYTTFTTFPDHAHTIKIDGVRPTVTQVTTTEYKYGDAVLFADATAFTQGNNRYGINTRIKFQITFSEAVEISGGTIDLNVGLNQSVVQITSSDILANADNADLHNRIAETVLTVDANSSDAGTDLINVNGDILPDPTAIPNYTLTDEPGNEINAAGRAFAGSNIGNISQIYIDGKKPDQPQSISICLLYTSPSPRDATLSRMPSSA